MSKYSYIKGEDLTRQTSQRFLSSMVGWQEFLETTMKYWCWCVFQSSTKSFMTNSHSVYSWNFSHFVFADSGGLDNFEMLGRVLSGGFGAFG
jgi:hypothetical protein